MRSQINTSCGSYTVLQRCPLTSVVLPPSVSPTQGADLDISARVNISLTWGQSSEHISNHAANMCWGAGQQTQQEARCWCGFYPPKTAGKHKNNNNYYYHYWSVQVCNSGSLYQTSTPSSNIIILNIVKWFAQINKIPFQLKLHKKWQPYPLPPLYSNI